MQIVRVVLSLFFLSRARKGVYNCGERASPPVHVSFRHPRYAQLLRRRRCKCGGHLYRFPKFGHFLSFFSLISCFMNPKPICQKSEGSRKFFGVAFTAVARTVLMLSFPFFVCLRFFLDSNLCYESVVIALPCQKAWAFF
uniref:Secreted protein n=1 Tax=Rhipicephalus zambeziensis TaxID=60191 RepID=A0A224Y7L8_9ACAR